MKAPDRFFGESLLSRSGRVNAKEKSLCSGWGRVVSLDELLVMNINIR